MAEKILIANDVKIIRELVEEIKEETNTYKSHKSDYDRAESGMRNAQANLQTLRQKLGALVAQVGLFPRDTASFDDWEEIFRDFCTMYQEQSEKRTELEMRRGE